ncbi:NAD/NADP-dependent betaine aldehyde dehydrogenase [Streptomyces rimosus subsp. rimosus]
MKQHDAMYIDGSWRPAAGTDTIDVVNPADERVIATVPAGTAEDVDAAVRAARAALPAWSRTAPAERAARLTALRDQLAGRAAEIAETITAELGAPLAFSKAVQAAVPVAVCGSYAELAATHPFEEKIGTSTVLHEPVGVVGAITPWNYPLHQIVAKVAPALAAGCTIVLKPAENTPLSAQLFAECVDAAGLPAGVFNLVTGLGPVAGQALAEHPDVDLVSFTGSTAVGKKIGAIAGAAVKRCALELGGKSANVVLPSADLAKAVGVGIANVMANSGQTCSAWTRVLVPADRYDEAVELAAAAIAKYVPGDPLDGDSRLGPVVSATQRDRVRGYIERGIEEVCPARRGRPGSPRGARPGLLRPPDALRRRHPRHDHRAGGDLRPGRRGPAVRGRGRGLYGSPTARSTAWRAPSGPATRTRRSPSRGAWTPARSTSTAGASTRSPRSAATSSPASAGNWARTA